MKALAFLMVLMAMVVSAAPSWAEGPEGFFVGGGANLLYVAASGTWSEYDFSVREPLSTEDGGPVGLSWTDKMLLGVKPVAGYKFNEFFALQVGCGLNIPKTSQQQTSESNGVIYYEQGLNIEWQQSNFEVLGIIYPNTELGYYFFGGFDMTWVDTQVTLYENAEYPDANGNTLIGGVYQIENDKVASAGFILGAGLEFASENRNTVVYVSGQYSRSMTDDTFFGTEDFKVDVGGLALMVGLKWYPFSQQ